MVKDPPPGESAGKVSIFLELATYLLPLGLLALLVGPAGRLLTVILIGAVLLPIALFAVLVVYLAQFLYRIFHDIGPFFRKYWKRIVIIGAVFLFLLVDLPFLTAEIFDPDVPLQGYWLQTVAGNWSPPTNAASAAVKSRYWYAFSAILAILLNNALYLVIIGVAWRLIADRSKAVETRQAYMLRDVDLKGDLFNFIVKSVAPALGVTSEKRKGLRDSLDKIFEKANESLPQKIAKAWGEEGETYLREKAKDLSPK